MSGLKIVFTGPVGAGKTTAIASLSDIEPFQTEEFATDETQDLKENTTVAMDYGLMKLEDGQVIHLYGTPGQTRFDFMWEILSEGAIGLVVLINAEESDSMDKLETYISFFKEQLSNTGVAVGITRYSTKCTHSLDEYAAKIQHMGYTAPVFEVDPREAGDVILLTEAMLFCLDPGIRELDA